MTEFERGAAALAYVQRMERRQRAVECVRGGLWLAGLGVVAAAGLWLCWHVLPVLGGWLWQAQAAEDARLEAEQEGLAAWYEEAAMHERLHYVHNSISPTEDGEEVDHD